MLTEHDEQTFTLPADGLSENSDAGRKENASGRWRGRLSRALRFEWLGQMIASSCWIASAVAYGISSMADWLQLSAACSWFLANIASIAAAED